MITTKPVVARAEDTGGMESDSMVVSGLDSIYSDTGMIEGTDSVLTSVTELAVDDG